MMNKAGLFFHTLCVCFVLSLFLSMMGDFKIGSLNLNGARSDVKRASLFKLIELKKLDVIFLQETHSNLENENDWKKEWAGEIILSHNVSNSGGVGMLFSKGFSPYSFDVEEIMCGYMLKVRVKYEDVTMNFINIYKQYA